MGRVRIEADGRLLTLSAHSLIGRHAGCPITLRDRMVSGEHASLHWTGEGWELRDLGSKNGTYLDGRRLKPGERAPLVEGAAIGLGRATAALVLHDPSAPVALARHTAGGEVRVMQGGLLALPSDDDPRAVIRAGSKSGWLLEQADEVSAAADQQTLVVAGEAWRLELPDVIDSTLLEGQEQPSLDIITLCFEVSQDEEHVQLSYEHNGRRHPVPARAYHYLLLTLARLRQKEQSLSVAERGWVDRERLCAMMGYDQYKLNVEIHRSRRQLTKLEIQGAARLIERRSPGAQLRIGTDALRVGRL